MTSRTQSPSPQLVAPQFEAGATVRTPAGNFATVIEVYLMLEGNEFGHQEVLVQYQDGERARFRASILRGLP